MRPEEISDEAIDAVDGEEESGSGDDLMPDMDDIDSGIFAPAEDDCGGALMPMDLVDGDDQNVRPQGPNKMDGPVNNRNRNKIEDDGKPNKIDDGKLNKVGPNNIDDGANRLGRPRREPITPGTGGELREIVPQPLLTPNSEASEPGKDEDKPEENKPNTVNEGQANSVHGGVKVNVEAEREPQRDQKLDGPDRTPIPEDTSGYGELKKDEEPDSISVDPDSVDEPTYDLRYEAPPVDDIAAA